MEHPNGGALTRRDVLAAGAALGAGLAGLPLSQVFAQESDSSKDAKYAEHINKALADSLRHISEAGAYFPSAEDVAKLQERRKDERFNNFYQGFKVVYLWQRGVPLEELVKLSDDQCESAFIASTNESLLRPHLARTMVRDIDTSTLFTDEYKRQEQELHQELAKQRALSSIDDAILRMELLVGEQKNRNGTHFGWSAQQWEGLPQKTLEPIDIGNNRHLAYPGPIPKDFHYSEVHPIVRALTARQHGFAAFSSPKSIASEVSKLSNAASALGFQHPLVDDSGTFLKDRCDAQVFTIPLTNMPVWGERLCTIITPFGHSHDLERSVVYTRYDLQKLLEGTKDFKDQVAKKAAQKDITVRLEDRSVSRDFSRVTEKLIITVGAKRYSKIIEMQTPLYLTPLLRINPYLLDHMDHVLTESLFIGQQQRFDLLHADPGELAYQGLFSILPKECHAPMSILEMLGYLSEYGFTGREDAYDYLRKVTAAEQGRAAAAAMLRGHPQADAVISVVMNQSEAYNGLDERNVQNKKILPRDNPPVRRLFFDYPLRRFAIDYVNRCLAQKRQPSIEELSARLAVFVEDPRTKALESLMLAEQGISVNASSADVRDNMERLSQDIHNHAQQGEANWPSEVKDPKRLDFSLHGRTRVSPHVTSSELLALHGSFYQTLIDTPIREFFWGKSADEIRACLVSPEIVTKTSQHYIAKRLTRSCFAAPIEPCMTNLDNIESAKGYLIARVFATPFSKNKIPTVHPTTLLPDQDYENAVLEFYRVEIRLKNTENNPPTITEKDKVDAFEYTTFLGIRMDRFPGHKIKRAEYTFPTGINPGVDHGELDPKDKTRHVTICVHRNLDDVCREIPSVPLVLDFFNVSFGFPTKPAGEYDPGETLVQVIERALTGYAPDIRKIAAQAAEAGKGLPKSGAVEIPREWLVEYMKQLDKQQQSYKAMFAQTHVAIELQKKLEEFRTTIATIERVAKGAGLFIAGLVAGPALSAALFQGAGFAAALAEGTAHLASKVILGSLLGGTFGYLDRPDMAIALSQAMQRNYIEQNRDKAVATRTTTLNRIALHDTTKSVGSMPPASKDVDLVIKTLGFGGKKELRAFVEKLHPYGHIVTLNMDHKALEGAISTYLDATSKAITDKSLSKNDLRALARSTDHLAHQLNDIYGPNLEHRGLPDIITRWIPLLAPASPILSAYDNHLNRRASKEHPNMHQALMLRLSAYSAYASTLADDIRRRESELPTVAYIENAREAEKVFDTILSMPHDKDELGVQRRGLVEVLMAKLKEAETSKHDFNTMLSTVADPRKRALYVAAEVRGVLDMGKRVAAPEEPFPPSLFRDIIGQVSVDIVSLDWPRFRSSIEALKVGDKIIKAPQETSLLYSTQMERELFLRERIRYLEQYTRHSHR